MTNPVKTPNVKYPREFQHLYTKEKKKQKQTQTIYFLRNSFRLYIKWVRMGTGARRNYVNSYK